ncbi:unnamed protein product [Spirodela intermedia]|uniref:Uncharacterized protein n=1 Tax=Spirodela intermedia TaxID=51605 RepID=A0ABN7ECS2_SPIIN|nr:unnamed protein product [Spirodela intermedia]
MKWVVESSPAAVTRGAEKRRLCGSPAAVTRRRGAGWRWGACQGASSSEIFQNKYMYYNSINRSKNISNFFSR